MNDLIKIEVKDGVEIQTVNARDLWEKLESKQEFANWIKAKLEGFEDGKDFIIDKIIKVQLEGTREVARPVTEFHLTIETGKHIAMLEKNEKGKEIRQYFIDIENAWNSPDMVIARALQAAQHKIINFKKTISELKPKAEYFDAVASSKSAVHMNDVAKTLDIPGIGRNHLFAFLREQKILMHDNKPYQEQIDCGRFRVVQSQYQNSKGEVQITHTTLVYQKGIQHILKLLQAHGKVPRSVQQVGIGS